MTSGVIIPSRLVPIKASAIQTPSATGDNHTTILRQAKESIEVAQRLRGDIGDSYVRVNELVALGLATIVNGVLQLANGATPGAPSGPPSSGGGGGPGPTGSTGPQGPQGPPGLDGDAGEDGMTIPGPAGAKGAAGAPGPFLPIWPEDPDEPLIIPGPRGATGSQGPAGGAGFPIFVEPDPPEDPMAIPGPVGPQGTPGSQGPAGVSGFPIYVEPNEPDDPLAIPGPRGPTGSTGATGPAGPPYLLSPEDPDDQLSVPGPMGNTGLQGIQGIQGNPGIAGPLGVSIYFEPEDAEAPPIVPGPMGPIGPQGVPGPSGSSSSGAAWAAYLDYDSEEEICVRGAALVCDVNRWSAPQYFGEVFAGGGVNTGIWVIPVGSGGAAQGVLQAFTDNNLYLTAPETGTPTGGEIFLRVGPSATTAVTINAAGAVAIAAPGSGDALTVNLLDNTNVSLVGPASPTDGFGIQWFNGASSPGWIGTGIWAISGATVNDIGLVSNAGNIYIGSGSSGTPRVKVANTGGVTINAPTSGEAFNATGAPNQYVAELIAGTNTALKDVLHVAGSTATGFSGGVFIEAGTNSSDRALYVRSAAGSTNFAEILGDGSGGLGSTSTSTYPFAWTSAGAFTIHDPGAHVPLTVDTSTGVCGIAVVVTTSSSGSGGINLVGDGQTLNSTDFEMWQDTAANSAVAHINNAGGSIFLEAAGVTLLTVASTGLTAAAVSGHTSLTVNGGLARPVTATKTSAYSMVNTDTYLVFNGSASITLTLLAAATYPGRELWVKTLAAFTVVSASSNVRPIGSATAGTAILPATSGAWALLVSDGTDWTMMANGT